MSPIPILHQDAHLAVVAKPAGLLVVPAPRRRGPTLVDTLSQQLEQQVTAVHRLDEDTTGVMVVALSDAGRAGMEELFRHHAIERDYLALLCAMPTPPAGCIDGPLREDAEGIMRVVPHGGIRAITHYQTLERRGKAALVRCRLETGRRNQIRAHFAAMGCPLVGDRKYGFRPRSGEAWARVMLHSWRLRFLHPLTQSPIECSTPPAEPELLP